MIDLPESEDKRMTNLRRAIVAQSDADWTTLLPQLDRYIDAQLAGEDYASLYPEIALQLDQSVEFSEAYVRLYDVAVAARAASAETTNIPQPDLTFLQPTLVERVQLAIEQTGNALRLRLNDALVALLVPPPTLAPALRAPDSSRYTEHILHLDAAVFTLDAYQDSAETTNCLLEITVEPPGKAWPELADSTVTVEAGDYRGQAQTDAFGQASFEHVPVEQLASLELAIELRAD